MAGISDGIAYLDRIGWSELIDPRWTNDVRKDLRESGLGLTEDEIVEICRIVIYPEPDFNSTESIYKDLT